MYELVRKVPLIASQADTDLEHLRHVAGEEMDIRRRGAIRMRIVPATERLSF